MESHRRRRQASTEGLPWPGGRQRPANGNPVTLVLDGPIHIRPLSRASFGDSGIGGAVSLSGGVHHQPTYLCQSERQTP